MRLLLDTHVLLWAITDNPRLPVAAHSMVFDFSSEVYYSVVSVWEISIKHSAHPENVSFSGKEFAGYCEDTGFQHVTLKLSHVHALETLLREEGAPPHRDPFDRMLIAQAKSEKMLFLTHDALLPYYNEPCIMFI